MSSKKPKVPLIVRDWFSSIVCLIIGVAVTSFAVPALLYVLDFNKRAVTTVATVIESQYQTQHYKVIHKKTTARPVVQFTDTQGKLQQANCSIPWRQYDTIKPGETFTIVYLPEDPATVHLDNNSRIYGSLFLLIAGIITTIVSIGRMRTLIKGKVEELQE